jgi:hypothetical protein
VAAAGWEHRLGGGGGVRGSSAKLAGCAAVAGREDRAGLLADLSPPVTHSPTSVIGRLAAQREPSKYQRFAVLVLQ